MLKKILPLIAAVLTQHTRQQVIPGIDFEWSSASWTHNLFRVLELVFWRRAGIRPEASAQWLVVNGKMVVTHRFYTIEALIAHTEGMVREFLTKPRFKFAFVPVPVLATPQGSGILQNPFFSFAIAFDNSLEDSFLPSPRSFSFTTSGSNRLLLVAAWSAVGSDTVTGITYNSVALSNGVSFVTPTDRGSAVKYLKGPATGSNTVTSTTTGSDVQGTAVSYTGALQTGGMDASTTNTASGVGIITTTITTVADQCWAMLWARTSGGGQAVASTGSTFRVGTNGEFFDSNGPLSPGSNSMTVITTSGNIGTGMISFEPAASAGGTVTVPPTLLFMGVG